MATIALSTNSNGSFRWETVTGSDVGEPISMPRGGIITTVHVIGTFGGALTMQGSVDGENWFTLTDMNGNEVSFTAAGSAEISTAARNIRPSAAAGVSDVDVHIAVSA